MVLRDGPGLLAEALGDDFEDGSIDCIGDFLVEFTDTQVRDGFNLALVGWELSVNDAQEGGFAFSVAAEQADAFALGDGETGIVEELGAPEGYSEIAV